ncbi:hypothetical protein BJF78_08955 [Pseudonocardia sp. CNS-139]|nr:hypothetical protein BJF78_08955 [Pseudonocardia sp. CNS-139]
MAESAHQRVLDWLSADGRDPADCSQAEFQQFAWHTVPYRGDGPSADVAEACAQLLDLSGRPRAAAAMRRHNPEVLAAWERSDSAGFRAFVKANDATGITPPDTRLLTWAGVFGSVEAEVLDGAERLLEAAVEDGRLVPGGRRWRHAQRDLLQRWLSAPVAAHGGAVPVDAVRAERRERWLESGTEIRGDILRRALGVIEPPPERPEPLQALLDVAVHTIPLTEAHRVPPAVIRQIAARLDWTTPGGTVRSERHVPAFVTLRQLATDAGMLVRRGRELRLGPAGRAAQSSPEVLAEMAARAWFGVEEFATEVSEIAASVLLEGPAAASRIADVARSAVLPAWRRIDGLPPDPEELHDAVHAWLRKGLVLGWVELSSDEDADDDTGIDRGTPGISYRLTTAGRRAAIAGLIGCAHAPRSRP